MAREVAIAVPLLPTGDAAAALGTDPGTWLPDARPQGLHDWLTTIRALGRERPVLCTVSSPLWTRSGVVRSLSWVPTTTPADLVRGDRWLPSFEGQLRVIGRAGELSLVLSGEVSSPFGPVGDAVHGLGLRQVADRSLDDLLTRIAGALTPTTPATPAGSRPN